MLRTRQHPHRARHPQPGVGGGQLGAALLALLLGGCDVAADDDDSAGDLQRAESDVAAAFDPALADGFWSFPFPSDARTIDGHPDLTGYPNPGDSNLLAEYIAFATDHLDGFGLNSPIWMRFDGEVSIPAMDEDSIRASRDCQGPLRLVDVTPQSPTYGRCTPLRWAWIDGLNQDPFVDSYTAVLAPYWGFPLRSGTTYAAYVVDAQDGIGAYLTASATLAELLEGRSPDTSLQAVYRPLADLFAADPSHLGARPEDGVRWIAAATVFTTQDAVGELEVLADSVLSDPDYPVWTEELTLLGSDHEHYQPEFDIWDGSYVAQNFQRGTIPYASEGGGFVFEDGVPVPQMQERIPFAIGMPRHGRVQPAEGWPVIVQMPGTGGDRFSHLDGSTLRPGLLAASRDFLSLSIPPPIHGDRWPAGNDLSRSLNSFNYFNPESGISMFRQGAIDIVAAVRFLQENLAAGGPIAEAHPELRINPDAIFYLGHSQGGIHGALAVPFAEGVHAWALSGAGGGLSMTMMQREDPLVIRDALRTAAGDPPGMALSDLHPVIGLVQINAERTDPINYAPRWVRESNGEPVSIVLTSALRDQQTPVDTSEALAVAGGLPIAEPYFVRDVFGLELRDLPPQQTPYVGNAMHPDGAPVTLGVAQFDDNHFVIFHDLDAATLWANLLYSYVRDGAPGEMGASYP
jgi:hypothetical protein